jgi:hypothetical protein
MQHRGLCDRIIGVDRNIRFVGIVNHKGEVIEGGFQHGIEPLLNSTDEQQMYVSSLSNMITLNQYSDRLGKVRYGITWHEKVALITFPLDDGILCLSTSSRADPIKIRDKVLKVIKAKSSAPRKSRK